MYFRVFTYVYVYVDNCLYPALDTNCLLYTLYPFIYTRNIAYTTIHIAKL